MAHGLLFRDECGKRSGRGRKATEAGQTLVMAQEGQEAAERIKDLHYPDGYEDDGYILSSAEALTGPKPSGDLSGLNIR